MPGLEGSEWWGGRLHRTVAGREAPEWALVCLTLGHESSEETRVLTKQETVGKGHWVESRRRRAPGGCPASRLTVGSHGDALSVQAVSSQP